MTFGSNNFSDFPLANFSKVHFWTYANLFAVQRGGPSGTTVNTPMVSAITNGSRLRGRSRFLG